jgi:hypothetical protein
MTSRFRVILGKLAPLAAAAFLLSSGAAHAQLGMPNNGIPPLNLGIPGASAPVGSVGIPFGSVEMGNGGLSPSPLNPVPGFSPSIPGMPANPALGLGGVSSLGTGLSPMLPPPASPALPPPGFPALAPGGTGVGSAPVVTNYGFAGMQFPPGSGPQGRGAVP